MKEKPSILNVTQEDIDKVGKRIWAVQILIENAINKVKIHKNIDSVVEANGKRVCIWETFDAPHALSTTYKLDKETIKLIKNQDYKKIEVVPFSFSLTRCYDT